MASPSPTTAVSSSSTLWATASKEWVIQPKPKPGRKPKKDTTIVTKPDDDVEVDSKGRRVQNRAAQRAFRERKQSQLAELQARVQSYEQGEIERNVALQNIAKRLKEENETLRRENLLLKDKVSRIERESEFPLENDRKRWRDDSPSSSSSSLHLPTRKKSKVELGSPTTKASTFTASYLSSPPSMVSSPGSNSTLDTPIDSQSDASNFSNLLAFASNTKGTNMDSATVFPTFDCGFCNDDTPCVCREIASQQVAERMGMTSNKAGENYHSVDPIIPINRSIRLESPPVISILENLPTYQPPVPLRRRPAGSTISPVFQIAAPSNPSCSGDPTNCMACADDAFGKAFCTAIEESVSAGGGCTNCPCSQNESRIGSTSYFDDYHPSHTSSALLPPNSDTMPTNDAWRQLKSHPNVAFADLSLLADVVSRRSKCVGPRVMISPAPKAITPERIVSPSAAADASQSDQGPILLIDPHAHYHEKERARSNGPSTSPSLAPQDVLMRCGRQRVREVHADAVQDALRLLDARFSHP